MSNIDPLSIAYETDVFGQESNDLFLAAHANEFLKEDDTDWILEVTNNYKLLDEDYESSVQPSDITSEIESKLLEEGYTVMWDNGVYIYRTKDLDLHDQ